MIRRIMAAVCTLLILVVTASGNPLVAAQEKSAEYCATEEEIEMLRRINQLREENGLDPLQLSEPLGAAAELKAKDMAEQNYIAHVSPDGQSPQDLLDEVGYTFNTATGENIAAGQQSAEATFQQWLNSPEHREIMLGEQFEAVGIGRAHNPDAKYDWYWAAELGGEVGAPAEACGSATPASTPLAGIFLRI